ncbi:MAG: HNH endonuclease signature motif containing protein, partial [Oscillospiraceae bacterium]
LLEAMQVDHVVPLKRGGVDEFENMLPACRSCNHYKSSMTLDGFRAALERMPGVLMRDSVTYKNAVRFGLVAPSPHKVRFYFEKL